MHSAEFAQELPPLALLFFGLHFHLFFQFQVCVAQVFCLPDVPGPDAALLVLLVLVLLVLLVLLLVLLVLLLLSIFSCAASDARARCKPSSLSRMFKPELALWDWPPFTTTSGFSRASLWFWNSAAFS